MEESKIKCQVCNAYLFPEDDIVYCPICGAPYHRDCYNKVGKCVFSEQHGTENQYQPEKNEKNDESVFESQQIPAYKCVNCGHDFAEDEKFCPNCRTPRGLSAGLRFSPDSLGGTQPDTEEDGVTATQVRAFTLVNTGRYVSKFFSLNKKNKISWNWAAFLLPEGWFFYRKMYKSGIIFILLGILSAVCLIPFNALIPAVQEGMTRNELYTQILSQLSSADSFALIMAGASFIISFFVRIFCGLFGDYIYKNFTKEKILAFKTRGSDELSSMPIDIILGKMGGVQPFMFIIGYWSTSLIPQLIQSLIL